MNKLLTPLELKIMNCLWDKGQANVKDMLLSWDEMPKPAYNTISTIVRILEEKKMVRHIPQGRGFIYAPLVSRDLYQSEFLENAVEQVFSGKAYSLVTKLVDSHKIDDQELLALRKLLDKFS